MCDVCGKPIPRTKKLCEECEKGAPPIDAEHHEPREKRPEEEEEIEIVGEDEEED